MIIYTCITNGYDEIPDSHYYDPDVQYVCFTDGTVERKGPWEFRQIPIEYECPRRLSAYVKINPHKVFPKGSKVVWLDGCYQMTEAYVKKSKELLYDHPFTIMRHVPKFTYLDEVLEGFMASMNSWEDVITISRRLQEREYNFFKYSSPVLGSIWRQITDEYEEFADIWWEWSLIGPNRDQISFDYAKQKTGIGLNIMENGWLSEERGSDGERLMGEAGLLLGDRGKVTRKKLHPKAGHLKQWMERDAILKELRPITGMHPKLYARYDHMKFVERNVLNPYLPES